jgi:hypothetical protein
LLTWYGVSAGVLSPLQEHITERLISYAGASLLVYDQYNANSMFVFDLSQPTPPMHLTSDATLHPALRYVVMGEAVVKLGDLGKTLKKGIVPDDLDFCDASYEAGMVLDVLQRLVGIMKQPPPTRRNPRRKINVSLKVANGFHRMLEKADAGLNFFNPDDTEVWEVEDISVTGFRSVIPAARADGIKIGSLVGSKPENVPHWGSGIVRRLSRDESGNLRVGVEVLSAQIVGVTLVQDGRPVEQGGQLALYLKRPADASGEAWVLMRPGSFSPQRSLNMIVGSTEYLLMPTALVESGDDYDLARFRLVEHETVTV